MNTASIKKCIRIGEGIAAIIASCAIADYYRIKEVEVQIYGQQYDTRYLHHSLETSEGFFCNKSSFRKKKWEADRLYFNLAQNEGKRVILAYHGWEWNNTRNVLGYNPTTHDN